MSVFDEVGPRPPGQQARVSPEGATTAAETKHSASQTSIEAGPEPVLWRWLVGAAVLGWLALATVQNELAALADRLGDAGRFRDLGFSFRAIQRPSGDANTRVVEGLAGLAGQGRGAGFSTGVDVARNAILWDYGLIFAYVLAIMVILRRWRKPTGKGLLVFYRLGTSGAAFFALTVAALADVVENVSLWLILDGFRGSGSWEREVLAWTATVAGGVKWVALVLVLTPLVANLVVAGRAHVRSLWRLWSPLLLGAALYALTTQDQGIDALRDWDRERWLASLAAVLVLGAVLSFMAARSLSPQDEDGPVASIANPHWGSLFGVGVALVLLATAIWLFADPVRGLAILVGLYAGALLFSVPIIAVGAPPEEVEVRDVVAVPFMADIAVIVGAIPLVALGLGTLRANIGDAFYRSGGADADVWTGLLLIVVVTPLVGVCVRPLLRLLQKVQIVRRTMRVLLAVLAACVIGVFLSEVGGQELSQWLGAFVVVLAFLIVAGAIVVVLRSLSQYIMSANWLRWLRPWALPPVLRILNISRPPFILAIVMWVLVASLIGNGDLHRVRVLDASPFEKRTLDDEVQEWAADAGSRSPVIVSSSGGGIRAAYWTAAVLDCAIEREASGPDPCAEPASDADIAYRREGIFAMSGISGGSVGIAAYAAHIAEGGAESDDSGGTWYRAALGDDYLAPILARWLFGDTASDLLLTGADREDRAAELDLALEASAPGFDMPLSEIQRAESVPLLLLNSYSLEDGCRFLVSNLDANPGRGANDCVSSPHPGVDLLDATTDLTDFANCGADGYDLRLSTAAVLSARFPFVGPSGRLDACGGPERTFLLDGGYRDVSAASTIAELWPAINDRLGGGVSPVFVQIDNGYAPREATVDESDPLQLLVPSTGQQRALGGVSHAARQALERIADESDGAYLRIETVAHPGSQAPLGWALSPSSADDLDDQLAVVGTSIECLRRLLDGGALECAGQTGEPTE